MLTKCCACLLIVASLAVSGCSYSEPEIAVICLQEAGAKLKVNAEDQIISIDVSHSLANDLTLEHLGALPHIDSINCTNAPAITGQTLHALANLPLKTLYLGGTSLDDAGLTHLKPLSGLESLNLSGTKITDAGLPAIDALVHLKTLSLADTAITDAGLVQLRDLRELKTLNLRRTKVTLAGVSELRRILPDTQIDR